MDEPSENGGATKTDFSTTVTSAPKLAESIMTATVTEDIPKFDPEGEVYCVASFNDWIP